MTGVQTCALPIWRGSPRATVLGMDREPRRVDLLTVALLVFFVALIALVAALLVLPRVLG